MKKPLLKHLILILLLSMLAVTGVRAQEVLIDFDFTSATLPEEITSDGTISTTGATGNCTECSEGRINIALSGYFQIDIPSSSVLNLKMKSSASGTRNVTLKYKLEGETDYTTLDVLAVVGTVDGQYSFPLTTTYPQLISAGPISIRLENAASGGQFHIHDIYVEGSTSVSTSAEITSFKLSDQIGDEVINSGNATVDITVPLGTDLISVVPSVVTLSANATINPAADAAQDFSNENGVIYTVTAQDETTTKEWTVKVTEVASSEKEIVTFKLSNAQFGSAVINSAAGTVTVSMPQAENITNLVPVTLTTSGNSTIDPPATTARDFSIPVVYTVTAQDNSTKEWTITVNQVDTDADIDFEVPVGFASAVTGSGTYNYSTETFFGPVTGGQHASDTLWVNGAGDFDMLAWHLYYRNRAYKDLNNTNGVPKAPLVIVLKEGVYPEGTSTSSAWGNSMLTIQEQGDLTIIGQGNVVLNFGLNVKRSWNVLIRNITFQDYYDDAVNIGEPETHHIWVDHCTFGHPTTRPSDQNHPDGGVDIKAGASYVTVSWCTFRNSWKTNLIGHSDSNGAEDLGKLKVTLYANHYVNSNSRNPRVRFGEVHVLNNLMEGLTLYGIAASNQSQVYAENNFYLNTRWPMYADRSVADFQAVYGTNTDGVFTSKTGNLEATGLKAVGNEYDDSGLPVITAQINPAMLNPGGRSLAFDEHNVESVFDPGSYYTYTPLPASEVLNLVPLFAGAGAIEFFQTSEETEETETYTLPPGTWTIYNANELPNAFDPAFSTSSGSYRPEENEIISDPEDAGNNLLRMNVSGPDPEDAAAQSQFFWRMNFASHEIDVTDLTVVVRAKGNPDKGMAFDLDMHYNDLRSRISIFNGTNLADIRNGTGTDATLNVDVTQWNVYRFVMTSTETRLYMNNDEEPSLVFTPQASISVNRHFRFGDGDSNQTMGADIDWVAWDVTGGAIPDEGYQLPEGTWTIYEANEVPNAFDPAFSTSSGNYRAEENEIISDPEDAGNNLLRMNVSGPDPEDAAAQSQFFWRMNFASHAIDVTDLTVVIRAKGNPDKGMAFDLDMHYNDLRSRISIFNGTNLADIRNGTGTDATLNVDVMQWNVYRFVMTSTETRLYMNNDEEPSLVFTPQAAVSGNRHFRFGDGDSNQTMGADIDWVAWDVTGGATAPMINVTATLSEFSQTIGEPSASQTYSVSGSDLTENITITPPVGYEVSPDEVTWFNSASPLALVPVEGAVESTTIYIRLNASEAGDYAGNIVHASAGATDGLVEVTGSAVDAGYQLPPGTWTIYEANELPNAFDPAFSTSSGSYRAEENEIISDPEEEGNNLLRMNVSGSDPEDAAAQSQFFWRMNFASHSIDVTDLTVVIRAKGNPDKGMAFDLDMHYNDLRSRISIFNGTNLADIRNGTGTDATLTVDVTEWNVYRFVMTSTETRLYMNNDEEPSLVFTPQAAVSGNRHFRFGDGDSNQTMGADIDWVAWDVTGGVAAPVINVTATLTEFSQTVGEPSATQTYSVSGSDLTENLTITPPAGYEVSADNGVTWFDNTSPLVLTQVSGSVASTTIEVRLNAASAGIYEGDITHTSASAAPVNLAVSGVTSPGNPLISVEGTLSAFSQTVGSPAAHQIYSVSGENLTAEITITPPVNYEVSGDGGTTWFTNTSPLVLTQTEGTIPAAEIRVRLNASSEGSYSGNIVHASSGATDVNLAVTGTATFGGPPTIIVTGTLSNFSQETSAPSATQTYTISGNNLTGYITITPPEKFQISGDKGYSWKTNSAPLILAPVKGTIPTMDIMVRLNSDEAGEFAGNIVHETPGGTSANQPVSGESALITGISTLSGEVKVTLAPNPVHHRLKVNREGDYTEAQLSIYSATGIKIISFLMEMGKTNEEVDISSFERGVYFVEYLSRNGRQVSRVIKL